MFLHQHKRLLEARALRFPSQTRFVPRARRVVCDFARSAGLTEEAVEDLRYAAGEALANAVEHGSRTGSTFVVRCWREPGAVVVEIEDDGDGFDPGACRPRPAFAVRGFGLTIMHALVDRVRYERNGRVVRLEQSLLKAKAEQTQTA